MKKILIVDDLRLLVEQQKSILNRSDFKIFTANSGEEALKLHRAEQMDLIVTDLNMPGIGGDVLCTMLRKDESLKHVSIIILCSTDPKEVARAANCGANGYLTKPLRPVQFIEKVSQLLDIPERQSYRVLLKVKIKGMSATDSFFCSSRNISVTGLLIESDKVFKKGETISCSFFLPGSECIVTEAEVMRTVKSDDGTVQYGVRYLNIAPKYRAAIDTFINSKTKKK